MLNYLISSYTKSAAVIVKLYSKKQAFSEYIKQKTSFCFGDVEKLSLVKISESGGRLHKKDIIVLTR